MSGTGTYTAAGGPRLTEFLDALPIASRWLAGHQVVWQTGQQDAPQGVGPMDDSHCSAFVAAVAQMLGIYVLRPPQHGQLLLANAQADWLAGTGAADPTAEESGWAWLGASGDAEVLAMAVAAARTGQLVLAIYKAPPVTDADGVVHQRPGHVCLVRPQLWPDPAPEAGPEVLSVGATNRQRVAMRTAFVDHPGAWPSAIQLYVHTTCLEHDVGG